MIRPDAIPVLDAASRAVLSPEAVAALFGKGYRLRGTERVRLAAAGHADVWIPVAAGAEIRVWLDALDREAVGTDPARLCGPDGHLPAASLEPVRRVLVLPASLRRAWGAPDTVTLQAGSVAFGGVAVEEGAAAGARLDRADRLAAGLRGGDTVRWRRDLDLASAAVEPPVDGRVRPTGRVITETDVRQARLRGQRILVRPGQILTPAARTLGRELGLIEWADG